MIGTAVIEQGRKMERLRKYGQSGGPEGRGILTAIKAADLPDEEPDAFSNAPYEFEATARMVLDDTQKMYYHAATANRFSEKYLKCLPLLEKLIRRSGSHCLTKAVLEQKAFAFPKLEDLSILELIRMVSFHIRKCHAAFDGLLQDNGRLGMVYLNWEVRWLELGERLRATETKIQKIRDGRLKADELVEREESFRGKPQTNSGHKNGLPQGFRVNPNALPLESSMAAEMMRREKQAEKERRAAERESDKILREWGAGPFSPERPRKREALPGPAPEAPEPEAAAADKAEAAEPPEGYMTIAEARKVLIEKAMKEGDQKALREIPLEDTEAFCERWAKYISEPDRRSHPPGPSGEVRKKLREKRKKKK